MTFILPQWKKGYGEERLTWLILHYKNNYLSHFVQSNIVSLTEITSSLTHCLSLFALTIYLWIMLCLAFWKKISVMLDFRATYLNLFSWTNEPYNSDCNSFYLPWLCIATFCWQQLIISYKVAFLYRRIKETSFSVVKNDCKGLIHVSAVKSSNKSHG